MSSNQILVDARQKPCPMPLLKLKQALNRIDIGGTIHLIATDPTSKRDCVSYIEMTNHQITIEQLNDELHFYVTKG